MTALTVAGQAQACALRRGCRGANALSVASAIERPFGPRGANHGAQRLGDVSETLRLADIDDILGKTLATRIALAQAACAGLHRLRRAIVGPSPRRRFATIFEGCRRSKSDGASLARPIRSRPVAKFRPPRTSPRRPPGPRPRPNRTNVPGSGTTATLPAPDARIGSAISGTAYHSSRNPRARRRVIRNKAPIVGTRHPRRRPVANRQHVDDGRPAGMV